MNKKEQLNTLIALGKPDIIPLTEILPKSSCLPIVDEFYNIDDYDRVISNTEKGRRIVMYIKSSLHPLALSIETSFEEAICAL